MTLVDITPTPDAILQWGGFIFIVSGAWFYASRHMLAAALTAAGCAALIGWCLVQASIPFGILSVQAIVGVLSIRNVMIFSRAG